jgi:peptidoglycan/LPS O-acetylase OafA/YrhL
VARATNPDETMIYRREIDGLRALAVIPVILFHAGISAFSGGFVGVDVFFVVSGYLITFIILDELGKGTFSLARFYERRARRILPALFLVLAFCLPLAWALLTPVDMREFAKSVLSVAGFASNVLFWQQSGYFDTASELKPLLHTWSLAVEEQFYVLFPLLLALVFRFGRRAVYAALGTLLFASLALAQWGATRAPDATFYLLPTRAWELMVGALAAVFVSRGSARSTPERHATWGAGAAMLGVVLIAYSVFAFDKSLPFPGVYALVPTLGALLIILFAQPHNLAGRILGSRWCVGIGLVSYSAYLWHQPLLAFTRHASLNEPPVAVLLAMCAASLVLAYFSWRFVEVPFRARKFLDRKHIFALSAAGLVFFAAFGALGEASSGFRMRWGPEFARFQPEDRNFFRYVGCASNPKKFIPPEKACAYGAGEPRIAVVGDSHARALVYELSEAARKRDFKVAQFTYEGCPPILDVYRADQETDHRCYEHNKATFDYLARTPGLQYVVLAARWPLYLEGARFDNKEGGVEKGQATRLDLVVNGTRVSTPGPGRIAGIQERMQQTIRAYVAAGKKVIVVQAVPEAGWYVPEYLTKVLSRRGVLSPADGSTSLAVYESRSRHAAEAFDGMSRQEGVAFVQPARHLCNTVVRGRCVTHLDAVPLYRDADHLSNLGVRLIVEDIMRNIRESPLNAPQ